MQKVKFIFVCAMTFALLLVILHSSISTYIEQKYHYFEDSENALISPFRRFISTFMNNHIFATTDSIMEYLNALRISIFTFDTYASNDTQEPIEQDEQRQAYKDIESAQETPQKDIDSIHVQNTQDTQRTPPATSTQQEQDIDSTHTQSQNLAQKQDTFMDFIESTESANVDSINDLESKEMPDSITHTNPTESTDFADFIESPAISSQNIDANYAPVPTRDIIYQHFSIDEGSCVVIMGDSMMQGIAPHITKFLKKHNVCTINLTKHSTGLTYKHYFDFSQSLEDIFATHYNIAFVVVLLGANDPWTMQKHIAFKSAKWEEIYTQRIEEIIAIAQSHGARIAWYEIPFVREKSLNDKIIYLNTLYADKVREYGEYFLQSNGIITQGGKYSAFIKSAKHKSEQVRIDDGVHFTKKGYQIMADIFLNALIIEKNVQEDE